MTTPIPTLEDRLRSHYRAVAESLPLAEVPLDDLVAGGPVRQLTDARMPARRTGRIAMLGLAAAALVAVGLVVAARERASTPTSADLTLAPGDVPLLVPRWLPGGLQLRGASDTTVHGSPPYRLALYATSSGVFTGKLLSVAVTAVTFESWKGAGVPTIVAGRDAVELSSAGVAKLVVDNGTAGSITLAGRGFTSGELASIVAELGSPSTDPADGPVLASDPAGLSLLSDEAGLAVSRGTELGYESEDLERVLWVAVWSYSTNVFEQYLVSAGSGESTEVDGHRAWRSTDSDGLVSLAWELAPGIVAQVSGTGVSADDVERVAQGLHPVSDAEWRRLLASVGVEPGNGDSSGAPPTTAGTPATAPCTEQQSSPPVTVVVNCP